MHRFATSLLALAFVAAPTVQAQGQASADDPRVGLRAGLFDAEEAISNLRKLSSTPPPEDFIGVTNSDLAFKGDYVIQGNYNGVIVWDVSDPASPELVTEYLCPASQSDVSVYGDLMFVSGEGLGGRLDCGTDGVRERVSQERLRGIRIFDISDIRNPEYVSNVQTCRGSHTHSVLKHPGDDDNVYIYVSGSAPVRPAEELPGCVSASPDEDPNSALFRIEVIQVPLADPASAAIVSSPRIFEDLVAPPEHGLSPADLRELEEARANGAFIAEIGGRERVIPGRYVRMLLAQMVAQRGGEEGETPTAADSTMLREQLPAIVAAQFGGRESDEDAGPAPGPTQCHDITLYPEIGLAGGACEGGPGQPDPPPGRRGQQLLLLALRHVQQRRLQGPLHRRVGRRRTAEVPRGRPHGVGRQRHLPPGGQRRRAADGLRELLQDARAADQPGELRGAQRLAHPHPRT